MSDTKVTDIVEIENVNISEEELPTVISEQFKTIIEIDKKIQDASHKCEEAKIIANQLILAKGMNQKDAINSTQDAVRAIAISQESLSEAQRVLFENQQRMAEAIRYLLMLGASSIVTCKTVISELEAKLKQASTEKLSTQSREDLIGLIKLLKDQESVLTKQERITEQVKLHGRELVEIHKVDEEQDETDRRHDALIAENATKNIEQDSEIARQQAIDKEHDKQIRFLKLIALLGLSFSVIAIVLAIISFIV